MRQGDAKAEETNGFNTLDIALAVHLQVNGVVLLDIQPQGQHKSRFCFEKPSQELLNEWLAGETVTKRVIDTYRHLLGDAKRAEERFNGGVR